MSATTKPTTKSPATVPASSVVPFPMPWGSAAPSTLGCCPPGGGMDKLLQCYCDIQAATAFITAIMIDAINNNPAVAEAIIAAIQKSGSNLPLIGVTDGSPAQPGQVGEYLEFVQDVPILGTAQTQVLSMGVLQPGDWDVWLQAAPAGWTADIQCYFYPTPAGFDNAGYVILGDNGPVPISASGPAFRALLSVPTLVTVTLTTNNSGPGSGASTCSVTVFCRRRR